MKPLIDDISDQEFQSDPVPIPDLLLENLHILYNGIIDKRVYGSSDGEQLALPKYK